MSDFGFLETVAPVVAGLLLLAAAGFSLKMLWNRLWQTGPTPQRRGFKRYLPAIIKTVVILLAALWWLSMLERDWPLWPVIALAGYWVIVAIWPLPSEAPPSTAHWWVRFRWQWCCHPLAFKGLVLWLAVVYVSALNGEVNWDWRWATSPVTATLLLLPSYTWVRAISRYSATVSLPRLRLFRLAVSGATIAAVFVGEFLEEDQFGHLLVGFCLASALLIPLVWQKVAGNTVGSKVAHHPMPQWKRIAFAFAAFVIGVHISPAAILYLNRDDAAQGAAEVGKLFHSFAVEYSDTVAELAPISVIADDQVLMFYFAIIFVVIPFAIGVVTYFICGRLSWRQKGAAALEQAN